jgi:hypothetical protein
MTQATSALKVFIYNSYLVIDENGIPRRLHTLDNKTVETALVRGWAVFRINGDELTILYSNGEWIDVEWANEEGMTNEAPSIKLFDECLKRPD